MREPKCPKCGSTNIRETLDFKADQIDLCGSPMYEPCEGICKDCNTKLRWNFIWQCVGVEDLEEIPREEGF